MADYGEAGNTARSERSRHNAYAEYLELPQLLSLQRPLADPPVHDEMLFVIVHQTHELWFKQMVIELRALIAQIDAGAWQLAEHTTDRLSMIVGLLIRHVDVLETMPAEEFLRFRGVLGSASGMQSAQFKLIEELAGEDPPASSRTVPRVSSTSVRGAFSRAMGAVIPANDGSVMTAGDGGFTALFRDPDWTQERRVAERLLHFDAEMSRWRARHMELARAMIGASAGTGGSSGARYLERRLEKRFFPELWAARPDVT